MTRRRGNPNIRCSICVHEQRHRIELALVSGASRRAVGRKFAVSEHAAGRHLANHMSQERRAQLLAGPLKLAELAERATEADLTLLDYLALVRSTLVERFLAASECSDNPNTALLAGRLTELLRLQASLTGELRTAGATVTNNIAILSSPLMADLQAMLVTRLRPYPEAARAVIEGLEQLTARSLGTVAAPPVPMLEAPRD